MPTISCRRWTERLLAVALTATVSSCGLFDWLRPPDVKDEVWDPIGSVQQRWYVTLSNSDQQLKPDPLWTSQGVIVPGSGGVLVAYNSTSGTRRWTANAGPFAGARPITRDGLVVVAETFGAAAFDAATGAVRWSFDAPEDERVTALNGAPGDLAYSARGFFGIDASTAYLPAWGGVLSAIDLTTGSARWIWRDTARITTPAGVTGATVSGDTIYVHTWNARVRGQTPSDLWLVALRRQDGVELWRYKLPEEGAGSGPSTAPLLFNNLLIVRQFQRIVAIDRFTRSVAWTFQQPDTYLANVDLALDAGRLFVALNPADALLGIHVALNAATGGEVWRTVARHSPSRDLVLSPTRVYSNHEAFITILDRVTGRIVARVKPPVDPTGCGFLSSTTVGGGIVAVRIGCTRTSSGVPVNTDHVWAFAEP